MKELTTRAVAVVMVGLLAAAAAAQDLDKVEIKTQRLADNLYVLAGAGGNIAVAVGPEGLLVVDTGYTGLTAKVQEAIAGVSKLPVRWVVNTHWHFDHTAGNKTFAEQGATIIAHPAVRSHMSSPQSLAVIGNEVPAAEPAARPVLTFDTEITMHLGDEEIRLLHLDPAHSDGDTVVVFVDANVIHTGDIVFFCGYPYIDITHGGSIDGMIAAVDRIMAIADDETRIIPGHGQPTSAAELATYRDMLQQFRDAVAKEKAAGKTLEEVIAGDCTAAVDKQWGQVFFPPAALREMVYRSIE